MLVDLRSSSDIWEPRRGTSNLLLVEGRGRSAALGIPFLDPVSPFGTGKSLHLDRDADTWLHQQLLIRSAPDVPANAFCIDWGSLQQTVEGLLEDL